MNLKSGLATQRRKARNIPSVQKANGKTGRRGLLIKDANVGSARHLVIDISCTHEFCGNNLKDVARNGQLRDPNVNKLLETTARTKVDRYRDAYATGRAPNMPLTTTDVYWYTIHVSSSASIHWQSISKKVTLSGIRSDLLRSMLKWK